MKTRIYTLAMALILMTVACNKINDSKRPELDLQKVTVRLELAEGQADHSLAGANVRLISGEMIYEQKTEEDGSTVFQVPLGLYSAYASARWSTGNMGTVLNGSREEIVVDKNWNPEEAIVIRMIASTTKQVIIKEMYTGGMIDPVTTKNYTKDSYFKLYNNSGVEARLKNFGMAVAPGASNKVSATMWETINYKGEQCYAAENWIPLHQAVWYVQGELVIPPYSDVVIAMCGAIDHSLTLPGAIDLSEADYVHYDPESGMEQGYMYPAPSEKIPASRYMKCVLYGMGFGWILPIASPALLIFTTEGMTPAEFAKSDATTFYPKGLEDDIMFRFKRLDRSWCLDAVEAFEIKSAGENIKRLTPDLDGGYIYQTWSQGHSVYRNVDKKATEAIPGNKEKLVYGYQYGTEDIEFGSTDPSGIDAEASMRNGAKIIYMDTNNSTNDFHLRKQPSLKDKA